MLAVALVLLGGAAAWFGIPAWRGGYIENWTARDGEVVKNLTYRDGLGYDLYLPAGAASRPEQSAVVFLHGGAWTGGSRKYMDYAARRYAKAGYLTATIDYSVNRDGNGVTMFRMLDDVGAAIEALKAETARRGYHVTRLALSGTSAGGHLALLYAYSRAARSTIPLKLVFTQVAPTDFSAQSWGSADTAAQLVSMGTGRRITPQMMLDGSADDAIRSISPVAFVGPASVPTVVAYGGRDHTVSVWHAVKLLRALDDHRIDLAFVGYPRSGHELTRDSESVARWKTVTLDYLQRYLTG